MSARDPSIQFDQILQISEAECASTASLCVSSSPQQKKLSTLAFTLGLRQPFAHLRENDGPAPLSASDHREADPSRNC